MILLVLTALIGAAAGVFLRPRLLGVPVALVVTGGVRAPLDLAAAVAVDNSHAPVWALAARQLIQSSMAGYLPLLAAAGLSALFAGLLSLVLERDRATGFWLPKDGEDRPRDRAGHRRRTPHMIDERAAHSKAEARQRSLLGL